MTAQIKLNFRTKRSNDKIFYITYGWSLHTNSLTDLVLSFQKSPGKESIPQTVSQKLDDLWYCISDTVSPKSLCGHWTLNSWIRKISMYCICLLSWCQHCCYMLWFFKDRNSQHNEKMVGSSHCWKPETRGNIILFF